MHIRPYNVKRALLYALLLWVVGFVWGTIVFMTPPLKSIDTLPYVSKHPAISIPLILFFAVALYPMTRTYLKKTENKTVEGMKLGATLLASTFVLDAVVYLFAFASRDYFPMPPYGSPISSCSSSLGLWDGT